MTSETSAKYCKESGLSSDEPLIKEHAPSQSHADTVAFANHGNAVGPGFIEHFPVFQRRALTIFSRPPREPGQHSFQVLARGSYFAGHGALRKNDHHVLVFHGIDVEHHEEHEHDHHQVCPRHGPIAGRFPGRFRLPGQSRHFPRNMDQNLCAYVSPGYA